METWDNVECRTELRFDQYNLQSLIRCLQIPERIVCQQGTVCRGMEGLCIKSKYKMVGLLPMRIV